MEQDQALLDEESLSPTTSGSRIDYLVSGLA